MIPGVTAGPLNDLRIRGRIKSVPEDFVVAEVLRKGIEIDGGRHILAAAEKRGLEHKALVQAFGREANFLGIKDKEALAYFFISFKRVRIRLPEVPGLRVRIVGRTRRLLTRKDLLGNAFRITIRDCECRDDAFRAWSELLSGWQAPNFYGPQRFARSNHLIGQAIIRRDFRAADELLRKEGYDGIKGTPLWLRRFYVQAYQSYLFNLELSKVISGEIRGPVRRADVTEDFFRGKAEIAYLPGYGFRDRGDAYSRALIEVAKEEGIKFRHFYVDEMKEVSQEGGIRPARIMSHKVSYSITGEDQAVVRFVLYRGSYATSALRELLLEEPL